MMTLEQGRTRTWRLPRFSALEMVFSASARVLMRTMASAATQHRASSVSQRVHEPACRGRALV